VLFPVLLTLPKDFPDAVKEKVTFLYISLGSVAELQNQLLIARDVGYLNSASFDELAKTSIEIKKMLNGVTRSLKKNSFLNSKY